MTRTQQRRRKWLLENRPKLSEVQRYELARLERLWEIWCGKAVQAGKVVTYLALAMMFVGGCIPQRIIRRMYEHQPTCPEEIEIQRRQDKARPEGTRDNTQWIPPKASGEAGDAV